MSHQVNRTLRKRWRSLDREKIKYLGFRTDFPTAMMFPFQARYPRLRPASTNYIFQQGLVTINQNSEPDISQ